MPIAINGSGTITGVSVGGLPDGIVDTDMIAAGAVTAAKRGAGSIVQVVNMKDTSRVAGSTAMVYDDTVPQNTEGNEFLTLSITPTSSSNKLYIHVYALLNPNGANTVVGALFQDSTANALATSMEFQSNAEGGINFTLDHFMTAGTTSSTTFKFRAGRVSANTLVMNGADTARLFGGVASSGITIMEIAA